MRNARTSGELRIVFWGTVGMSDVTALLNEIHRGERSASDDLMPLLYEELRRLAASKMSRENPGMTLQATALVHEAYMRLVHSSSNNWANRAHFFSAAAEAMRRILVEQARAKACTKRGGDMARRDLSDVHVECSLDADILSLDEALKKLELSNPDGVELVKLRFFSGFTNLEAARALGISPRKANQLWAYARAWLLTEMDESDFS